MRNIKTIFILVLSLILLLAVSCSNEDKTGGETETTETTEIEAKDFPTDLLVTYRDEEVASAGYSGVNFDTKVSYDELNKRTKIIGVWIKDGATTTSGLQSQTIYIEKWKKTTKGGNPIKLEGEYDNGKGRKYTVIYDYDSGTLSGTYTSATSGDTYSFNGKKI